MDRDPVKTAVRNGRKQRRLPPDAACFLCDLPDLAALQVVQNQELNAKLRKSLHDVHHVVGWNLDSEWTVVLCRNCHAMATEGQAQNGVELKAQGHVIDRVLAWLRALVAFLESMVGAVRRLLDEFEAYVRRLDSSDPAWRNAEEKQ